MKNEVITALLIVMIIAGATTGHLIGIESEHTTTLYPSTASASVTTSTT